MNPRIAVLQTAALTTSPSGQIEDDGNVSNSFSRIKSSGILAFRQMLQTFFKVQLLKCFVNLDEVSLINFFVLIRMKSFRHFILSSMRELVFGLEDSLVSTLGTITGIAVGTQNTYVVILSGFVLIAAESTSMAAGSYLSSRSAEGAEDEWEKEQGRKKHHVKNHPIRGALVMWVSYVLGGFIPLAPYFFLSISRALLPSILLTVVSLFIVGAWSGIFTKRSFVRSGFEMVIVSLSAALIGYLIGRFISENFGVPIML